MDTREEHKRLLALKYPTRQDMRECMWLGKGLIEELEQLLVDSEAEIAALNSEYKQCYNCGCTESEFFDKKSDINCGVKYADIIIYICKKCKHPIRVDLA